MNLFTRIKRKVEYLRSQNYTKKKTLELQMLINKEYCKARIYLFCAPTHSNLGDQAQLLCWLRLFNEWYPDHEVICVPTRYRQFQTLRNIHKVIKKEDKIFIHSGYLIFDPHPELPFILDIVRAFYDKPIIILPQTVNLVEQWYKDIVANTFNLHPNLTLVCRDEVSLKKAQNLFPKAKLTLMPDVVTSLIGNNQFQYHEQRNGIMLCTRNDGEKFYSDEQLNNLKAKFKGIKINTTDTTIKSPIWEWDKNREKLIRLMLKEFSKYQVIITDRYHGTIFSQIVNTPVIVLSSTDHKLSSGVKWFPQKEFSQNVFFAKDLEEAYILTTDILKRDGKIKYNPTWFKNNYYSTKL